MNIFENRRWLVLPANMTGSIDFTQVLETSPETLRYSIDQTKTFVKYDVNIITASYTENYVNAKTGESGSYIVEAGIYGRPDIYSAEYTEYNHQEILELLATPEWTQPLPIG